MWKWWVYYWGGWFERSRGNHFTLAKTKGKLLRYFFSIVIFRSQVFWIGYKKSLSWNLDLHHEMPIIESVRVTELSPSLMKVHYGSSHILLNEANSFCPCRSINFLCHLFSQPLLLSTLHLPMAFTIRALGSWRGGRSWCCCTLQAERPWNVAQTEDLLMRSRDAIESLFFTELKKYWIWCSAWFPQSCKPIYHFIRRPSRKSLVLVLYLFLTLSEVQVSPQETKGYGLPNPGRTLNSVWCYVLL